MEETIAGSSLEVAISFPLMERMTSPGSRPAFAAGLSATQNVTVVPGSYLARAASAGNPGAGFVRISLVATAAECVQAARRIRDYANTEWRR